ncbi:hypothetical protein SDJN02_18339, partial [Cucurbita argyrosperma subsp. argyrosperma]
MYNWIVGKLIYAQLLHITPTPTNDVTRTNQRPSSSSSSSSSSFRSFSSDCMKTEVDLVV